MVADAATLEEKPVTFAVRTIDAKGASVEIAEAGEGAAVLWCGRPDAAPAGLLADGFRVVATAGGADFASLSPAMKARRLVAVAEALELEEYSVCVSGADSSAALHLAADEAEKLQRAILIEPQVYDAKGVLNDPALAEKLANIACHSLALFGVDSGGVTNAATSHYRERVPNCHLMYVYAAADIVRDRPQAAASVIADFLRRGDGFLVSEKDGRLHP